MAKQKHQAIIDELMDEIFDLRQENERLESENRRLGGSTHPALAIQERVCVHCHRRMPDGPHYFPGYFEEPSTDLRAEAWRHACIYCRGEGR